MNNKSRLAAIAILFGCLGFLPLVLTMMPLRDIIKILAAALI